MMASLLSSVLDAAPPLLFAALGRFGLGSMPHVSAVAPDSSEPRGATAKFKTTR